LDFEEEDDDDDPFNFLAWSVSEPVSSFPRIPFDRFCC